MLVGEMKYANSKNKNTDFLFFSPYYPYLCDKRNTMSKYQIYVSPLHDATLFPHNAVSQVLITQIEGKFETTHSDDHEEISITNLAGSPKPIRMVQASSLNRADYLSS